LQSEIFPHLNLMNSKKVYYFFTLYSIIKINTIGFDYLQADKADYGKYSLVNSDDLLLI
jgi:hypothetical protein